MTKKEIYENVRNAIDSLLIKNYQLPDGFAKELNSILDKHLAPKPTRSINLEEVAILNEDGTVKELKCSLSGKFFPATEEYFYTEKQGKGVNGLKRLSKFGESKRKKHLKLIALKEKEIMQDVFEGKLSTDEGKNKVAELKNQPINFN